MKNREVKEKVKTAFESVTPDNIDKIREKTDAAQQVAVAVPSTGGRKKGFFRIIAAAAACAVLMLALGVGIYGYNMNYTTVTAISFDVNPSMTMTLNGKGRVREVTANNADAQRVLEGLDFEGSTYEVAANAIIGAMLRTGYLSELSNSVLVSVSDDHERRSKEIEDKILAEIQRIFALEDFNGAVICQSVDDNAQLRALAEEYGITMGKASLIDKILQTASNVPEGSQATNYTFRDLAGLTINELNVLAESFSVNFGDGASGTASTQGYIGEEKAREQALAYAGVSAGDVVGNIRTEFDFEKGSIVYEVSFRTAGYEYEVKVNAANGKFAELSEEVEGYAGAMGEALSDEQIRAAAVAKAGIEDKDVVAYRAERDGREYEVEFRDEKFEYKLDIRADGLVLSYEKEIMDYAASVPGEDQNNPGGIISAAEAREIAFATAAERWSEFDVSEVWDYDDEDGGPEREDGVLAYEVEFKCGGYEYEFRIKASDGTVIKAERERDD